MKYIAAVAYPRRICAGMRAPVIGIVIFRFITPNVVRDTETDNALARSCLSARKKKIARHQPDTRFARVFASLAP